MNFDWQTEQEREDVWEPVQEPEAPADRSSRRRRWLTILAVVGLLLLAGLLVRREAQQRVEEATAMVEEEVASSHNLGLQAAQAGDSELFVTLLSGREPAWTETQKALLEADLLYSRAARPFGLRPAGEPRIDDVSFSPDLRAAELQMAQDYMTQSAETVTLHRTLVYREGQQRWLLAPPEAEFWGSWDSVTEGALTVDYPMRDEEIARQLAGDLAEMLARMCETLAELDCEPGWWMRLRFEKDPESLLAIGEAEAGAPAGSNLSLPAPSLVGLPAGDAALVGDAAYEALFRGYARHLAAVAIGDLVGWECCGDGTLLYQALLHEQLARLGLRPSPASLSDYVYLIDEGMVNGRLFDAVNDYWNEERPVPPGEEVPLVVHAFLAHMREAGLAQTDVAMLRSLAAGEAPSLVRWVDPSTAVGTLRDRLTTGFERFARQQFQRASEEITLPAGLELPQRDLLLACGGNEGFDLYRYELATREWSLEMDLNGGYVQMVGDDPRGTVAVLAYNESADGISIQNVLWRPEGEAIQISGPDIADVDQAWLPLTYGPDGQLAAFLYTLPVEESEPSAGLVDVETCQPGGCDVEPLTGLPIWSPSGAHLLALDVFRQEITLHLRAAGEDVWQEVGRAWAPVWLDDETYAYVPYAGDVRLGSLYAASIADREPQRLVPAEDLMAALPAGLAGRQPAISWVLPHPLDENQLLVAARNQARSGQLLYRVERAESGVSWLDATLTITFIAHFEEVFNADWIGGWFGVQGVVSPNGRWILLPTSAPEGGNSGIVVYDLANGESVLRSRAGTTSSGFLGHTYAWSPNGEWLVRPVAGMLDLIAPGYQVDGRPYRYRQLIVHDFDDCAQAVWVDGG